ncbi:MAG TPA: hypothetical protein VNM90_10380 [Haliangium sp.]|nr:hypothetical protein [Haliangium sp.]
MSFEFRHLDDVTRGYMLEEIQAAQQEKNLYYSRRFNDHGLVRWPRLLQEAARRHDDHWLAYQLEAEGLMKGLEGARTPSGGYTIRHVPHTAAETMAEGQFNRYYILGVCRRALAEGKSSVIVYRAKQRAEPSPEPDELIGASLDAQALHAELRRHQTSLEHELLQPNSTLSVCLSK